MTGNRPMSSGFFPDRFLLEFRRMVRWMEFTWNKVVHRRGTLDNPVRDAFYHGMWKRAAESLALDFHLDDRGYCRIGKNGNFTVTHQNLVMMDYPLTIKIARDKAFVLQMLSERGVHTPPFLEFPLADTESAADFLGREGVCVVKPAHGSAGGDGVTTNVRTVAQLKKSAIYASLFSRTILIEKQIAGDSYRLLYLNGTLVDAIRRRSPSVPGDGRSTIRQLILAENDRRRRQGGTTALTLLRIDDDCLNTLKRSGFHLRSVPPAGVTVMIKQAANDNSSNENEPAMDELCASIVKEGEMAVSAAGVSLAGVDLITTDPGRPLEETGGAINEVNTTPGLHYHYQVTTPGTTSDVAVPILRHLLNITVNGAGRGTV